jgi:hypothetical protein
MAFEKKDKRKQNEKEALFVRSFFFVIVNYEQTS